ncbi:hypothetical protein ASPBRDRAFT_533371 [Aspergillus brasiliensis CBS 101740]|uniref:C2H2-type domain-containing protein n=1 Tax=Aspergillus brasiliensis (strain CBS 101740 / IMI 381727 / IBT 21946) TaxID=767769 RepID=A0A1L9U1J5_ASPBC|nr:hypothetical protein ASPBRDRAFT_533371 [Aspergillus brasiliensis CBS 101740]
MIAKPSIFRSVPVPSVRQTPRHFYCGLCTRSFESRTGLRQHDSAVHSWCTDCGQPFRSPEKARKHRLSRHGTSASWHGWRTLVVMVLLKIETYGSFCKEWTASCQQRPCGARMTNRLAPARGSAPQGALLDH